MTIPMLVAKENVPIILQIIGKDIEGVIDTFTMGRCSYYNVVKELQTAHRQLWILPTEDMHIQAWLVTRIENHPFGKRLVFDLFGGENLDLILTHLDAFEDWARAQGAVETFAYMRPGLRRRLKKYGFRHVCDIVVRPLNHKVH